MKRVPHIVIVGSINMDLVTRVKHLPRAGETTHGNRLLRIPGGKGANQAVAVAKLGAQATMVGRVGDDDFGTELRRSLADHGVCVDHVVSSDGCSSGVAMICVEASGENAITVISGANGRLMECDIERLESVIQSASAVMLQLEVPLPTVQRTMEIARCHRVLTVLDPAPMPPGGLPDSLLEADLISPNQTEAEILTGIVVNSIDDAAEAARVLHNRGAKLIVVKLGEQGALISESNGHVHHVATTPVDVIDTTAAGDAFTAAMTVGIGEGLALVDAVEFGCAAGTLAVTRVGAQPTMPTREELEGI